MTQITLQQPEELSPGLAYCNACDHTVPDACVCLYCGAKLKEIE